MNQHSTRPAVDIEDIRAAAERIAPHTIVTPLLESPRLNDWLGFRLLVKCENLQHTGSFKLRGATNAVMSLPDSVRTVVAYSSGNHAQAVARAASRRGMSAVIVMPADAPALKIEGTRSYGAEVVTYDRYSESRETIGNAIAKDRNAELIRPFEDVRVIAGQGTIGLEIAAQCAEAKALPDHVISCCGGGGLIAGISTAVASEIPEAKIWAAEPEGFDDTIRSLESGQIQSVDPANRSICDAVVTPSPGEITFGINSRTLAGGFAVSDELVLQVMATAFKHLKLVIEPGGAVALAAALDNRLPGDTGCAVAVASGGNVDPQMFERALAAGPLF
ncbi:MAG: threonine ammonia-lyase [SAR116 cluster bacterium MED-G06]|nr:MAG: threonine ammonia-lyase [SAR116 cluster bacterium MED-G06]HBP59149.1 threonine ammonia-lyase [Alphaproteobacteria bacterium]HCA92588.1 threonine ammonia-lyase [Alphaproteobacteria bacterium]|tara:strand:- start:4833 stop:5831 length:999 start_codon:yes stop_codon:yes gene_type:complete